MFLLLYFIIENFNILNIKFNNLFYKFNILNIKYIFNFLRNIYIYNLILCNFFLFNFSKLFTYRRQGYFILEIL